MAARTSTTKPSTPATPDLPALLAALPADQLQALLAAAGQQVPAQATGRPQAKPKPSDPALADVQAAVANAVGCMKSRGALVNGKPDGPAYGSGSRGYRGTCKITVDGVDMSLTLQAVIWHTKPQADE